MKYAKFEDWFDEIENYGFRSERFLDEFKDMSPERAIEWLRAAFECGKMNDEIDSVS